MDMVSVVSSFLAMQASNLQTSVGAAIMKSNADAEQSAVMTLLGQCSGPGSQANLQANLQAGVGRQLDITS